MPFIDVQLIKYEMFDNKSVVLFMRMLQSFSGEHVFSGIHGNRSGYTKVRVKRIREFVGTNGNECVTCPCIVRLSAAPPPTSCSHCRHESACLCFRRALFWLFCRACAETPSFFVAQE